MEKIIQIKKAKGNTWPFANLSNIPLKGIQVLMKGHTRNWLLYSKHDVVGKQALGIHLLH